MKVLSLKSTTREAVGKGQARLLRRSGLIPAILYGKGTESIKLSVKSIEINKIFRTAKINQFLLDLEVDDIIKQVTLKKIQKHPVTSEIIHIDFYEVTMNRKIRVSIPIVTVGVCKGADLGGMLQLIRREVEVLCLPGNIPDSIVIDITDLDVGDSFHVMDLKLIDDGIEIPSGSNFTILTVLNQRAEGEDVKKDEEKEIEDSIISGDVGKK